MVGRGWKWHGRETGHNKKRETGPNKKRETGHNKWHGRETGHNMSDNNRPPSECRRRRRGIASGGASRRTSLGGWRASASRISRKWFTAARRTSCSPTARKRRLQRKRRSTT